MTTVEKVKVLYDQGLTYKEIANQLGVSIGHVAATVSRHPDVITKKRRPNYRRLTAEEKEQIYSEWLNGSILKDIAIKFDISINTVSYIVHKSNN